MEFGTDMGTMILKHNKKGGSVFGVTLGFYRSASFIRRRPNHNFVVVVPKHIVFSTIGTTILLGSFFVKEL